MGPLANLFRRSDSSSPSKKQHHSTLDVPLPTSPFNLVFNDSTTDDAGDSPPLERRFGPRLPREAASSGIRYEPAGPSEPPTLARSGQGFSAAALSRPEQTDVLAQRIAALSLRREDAGAASASGPAFAPSTSGAHPFFPHTFQPGLIAVDTALPGQSRPLVPFTSAVRALRNSSGPPATLPLLPPPTLPLLPPDPCPPPPPLPYSPAHSGLASQPSSSSTSLAPKVPPRPPFRSQIPSSPSGTDTSRQPFAPGPPTPPQRRSLPSSQSAPVLPRRDGPPVTSRAPGERGAVLAPPLEVAPPTQYGFGHSSSSATSAAPPQTRPPHPRSHPCIPSSSKSFPAAEPRPSLPDENELPLPRTIGRTPGYASPPSPASSNPSPITPVRKAPRRSSEPARTSHSPASARSSPASSRRGAKSLGQSRQCDGITALSKRCTRTVSLAGWTVPAEGVDLARESVDEGLGGPVYCKQHAKLALVDSGCFVTVKSDDGAAQERWILFSGEFSGLALRIFFVSRAD